MTLRRILAILCALMPLFLTQTKAQDSTKKRADSTIRYEVSGAWSVGGESRFSFILPALSFTRKHILPQANYYYGVGVSLPPPFLWYWGTLNGLCGVEITWIDLEASYSFFCAEGGDIDSSNEHHYQYQHLFNCKLGYKYKRSTIRLVSSFVLREIVPAGYAKFPILDLGKVSDAIIIGIEFRYLIAPLD